jgi:hypothetical protein
VDIYNIHNNPQKKEDQDGINQTKLSQLAYARGQMTFDEELAIPGMPQSMMKNQKGLDAFNNTFVPLFNKAFAKYVSDPKKDPYDFLTKDNVDKLIADARAQAHWSKNDQAMARLAAAGEAIDQVPGAAAAESIPAAPRAIDPDAW